MCRLRHAVQITRALCPHLWPERRRRQSFLLEQRSACTCLNGEISKSRPPVLEKGRHRPTVAPGQVQVDEHLVVAHVVGLADSHYGNGTSLVQFRGRGEDPVDATSDPGRSRGEKKIALTRIVRNPKRL